MRSIQYRNLTLSEISPELFSHFDRYQNVTRCWRKENGNWVLKDIAFVEQWDAQDYLALCRKLQNTLRTSGAVIAGFEQQRLCGFAAVENQLFGPQKEYLQLSELYVSCESRGKGIGRELFRLSCLTAKERGAKKLYLSAHSSEESQAFYQAVGCCEAAWQHPQLVAAEPCDCQLEKVLDCIPSPTTV